MIPMGGRYPIFLTAFENPIKQVSEQSGSKIFGSKKHMN